MFHTTDETLPAVFFDACQNEQTQISFNEQEKCILILRCI